MKIKVKDYEIEIIETDDKKDADFWDKKEKRPKLFGNFDPVDCRIKIWKDMSEIQKRKTLMHELTHAFLFVYWGSHNLKQRYDNEDMCSFMETYGEDIMRITNEYFLEKESRFLIEKVEKLEKEYVDKREW